MVAKPPTTAQLARLAAKQKLNRMLLERGNSGTKNFAGIIQDEYLAALSYYQAPIVYDRMRRSDATCAALAAAYIMPILSAKWYIQPFDDSPLSLQMADFMHDCLWNFGQQTFDGFLSEAMTCLPFGFSWFEKIFDWLDMPEWHGKIGWSKFAFRYQNTAFRFNTPLVSGPGGVMHRKLTSVTQLAPPDYKMLDIPAEKLVIFTNQKEGDNFVGISIFRPAYKHWVIKDALYKIQGIGLERAAVGVPFFRLTAPVDDDTYAYIMNLLENLRVDDQAGVMYDGNDGELGYLDGKFNAAALQMAIDHHDGKILESGLAQFVNLGTRGMGTTGSYGLSEQQSQMFLDVLNGKANAFASDFHLQATIQLLEWNFPAASRQQLPRLAHGDIGSRAVSTLAVALNAFAQYGFVTPDLRTENVVRELIDFPEKDEGDYAAQVADTSLTGKDIQGAAMGIKAPKKQPKAPDQAVTPQGNGGSSNGTGSQVSRKKIGGAAHSRSQSLTGTQTQPRAMSEKELYKLSEEFAGELDAMKRFSRTWEPERPSVKMARSRRPYEIRSHAPGGEEA